MTSDTPALRPPPEYADLRWHWIDAPAGLEPWMWDVRCWIRPGESHPIMPNRAFACRYSHPCTPAAIVPDSAAGGMRKESLRVEPNADLTTPNAEIERLKAEIAELTDVVRHRTLDVHEYRTKEMENERLQVANARDPSAIVPDSADEAMVEVVSAELARHLLSNFRTSARAVLDALRAMGERG